MSNNHFELNATDRSADLQGKGASRRLRKQNLVPAIIYGGGEQPTAISIKINVRRSAQNSTSKQWFALNILPLERCVFG